MIKKKLKIVQNSKNFQKRLDINIMNYRQMSAKFFIGERNGIGKEYNYDGHLIFEGEYKNGKKNGKVKKYNDEGILKVEREYLEDERFDGTLMYTKLLCILKDGTPIQAIIFPEMSLCEFLYYHVDCPDDTILEYLKHCLRHEVGHLLSNFKLFKEHDLNEASKIFMNEVEETERLWNEYIKEHDFDTLDENGMREYYTYYHNLPMEKKANEAVGIDIVDTVEWEIRIEKESDNDAD